MVARYIVDEGSEGGGGGIQNELELEGWMDAPNRIVAVGWLVGWLDRE